MHRQRGHDADAIAVAENGRLKEFIFHALESIAWALATAIHTSPELFDAIAEVDKGRSDGRGGEKSLEGYRLTPLRTW